MAQSVPSKLSLKSTTSMSLNERFSHIKSVPPAQTVRVRLSTEQQANARNKRQAQQMANRPAVQNAMGRNQKTVKQRLGDIKARLGDVGGMRGRGGFIRQRGGGARGRGRGQMSRGRGQYNNNNFAGRGAQNFNSSKPIRGGFAGNRGRGRAGFTANSNQDHANWNFRGRRRSSTNQSIGRYSNKGDQIRGRGAGRGVGRGAGRGFRGRGRGAQRGGRGRGGRGRGSRGRGQQNVTQEQLDQQLDDYMANTKTSLDKELDAYMAQSDD